MTSPPNPSREGSDRLPPVEIDDLREFMFEIARRVAPASFEGTVAAWDEAVRDEPEACAFFVEFYKAAWSKGRDSERAAREAAELAAETIAAKARDDERRYIARMIRENATDLLLFARGRSLDLLAWILELPEKTSPQAVEEEAGGG